jgi:molybdopterin-guanine dinucleotide biosynthesis protein A
MGGGDKALAELAGRPMIAHVIARLRPQVAALAVNANGDPMRFAAFGLPVLPDPVGGFVGPLAGLLAAMQWARRADMQLVVTAPADTPFLPGNLVTRLHDGIGTAEIAVAHSRGAEHPTIALWRTSLADDLARWLRNDDHRAVHAWIGIRRAVAVDFPDCDEGDPFFNVNTPADLESARNRVRKHAWLPLR